MFGEEHSKHENEIRRILRRAQVNRRTKVPDNHFPHGHGAALQIEKVARKQRSVPRGKDSAREEFASIERRELCAFFQGYHRHDSTVAAHSDTYRFRLVLAPHYSVFACCAAKKGCVRAWQRAIEE
jgi:hypothetical protein